MKYNCGHEGCEICGGRTCAGFKLTYYGKMAVCEFCIPKAIKFAMEASETFSAQIDLTGECAKGKKSDKIALTDKAIDIVRERAGLPDGWIPLSAEEGALSKLAIELVEKSLKSKEK